MNSLNHKELSKEKNRSLDAKKQEQVRQDNARFSKLKAAAIKAGMPPSQVAEFVHHFGKNPTGFKDRFENWKKAHSTGPVSSFL